MSAVTSIPRIWFKNIHHASILVSMSLLHQLTNRSVPGNILLFIQAPPVQDQEKVDGQTTAFDGTPSSERLADRYAGRIGKKGQSDTLDIASLYVKNVKTNPDFVKYLSSRFLIIFLQETWLYRYQTSILADIFDNTEFACGCVDDDAPVPPSLHMRGHGGTCILWHSSLNSLIKKLPETSVRINVVELKCPMALFCLVNVCLPMRGVAENETLFEECLDELHEIFIKYSPTHTISFGGDFNASLHRGGHLRSDVLFQKFVIEHGLQPDSCYPTRDTFFHASSDSSSQIDYFLVGPSGMRLKALLCFLKFII